MSDHGHLVLPDRLPESLTAGLAADAARYGFTPPHPRAGGAFAKASLRAGSAPAAAAAWIAARAEENGLGFVPNEASYQRYEATGRGLPPHRDQRYYTGSIAIVTVDGSATFAAHRSRDLDDVEEQWSTTPGQVILLRGWSPGRETDPRPYHRVDPPTLGSRLMFQLRHLVSDGEPWPAELTATEAEQARSLADTPESPRIAGGAGDGR